MDFNIVPGYSRATDPDVVLCSRLSPDIIMAPGAGQPLIPTYSQAAAQPLETCMILMATGSMNININLGHCRATNPDTALTHPDNTMAQKTPWPQLVAQATQICMTLVATFLRLQQSHRLHPRPQDSTWLLAATWTMEFNTDPSCGRTTDADIVLGSNPGLNVTMAPASGQAIWMARA